MVTAALAMGAIKPNGDIDVRKVLRGLAREDLFTVVLEHFQTDTADYADIVLPATTQLEHWDVHFAYGHHYVTLNRPSITPVGEARPNSEIFRLIAARMGMTHEALRDDDLTLDAAPGEHTVAVLLMTNFGVRSECTVDGVPVGAPACFRTVLLVVPEAVRCDLSGLWVLVEVPDNPAAAVGADLTLTLGRHVRPRSRR